MDRCVKLSWTILFPCPTLYFLNCQLMILTMKSTAVQHLLPLKRFPSHPGKILRLALIEFPGKAGKSSNHQGYRWRRSLRLRRCCLTGFGRRLPGKGSWLMMSITSSSLYKIHFVDPCYTRYVNFTGSHHTVPIQYIYRLNLPIKLAADKAAGVTVIKATSKTSPFPEERLSHYISRTFGHVLP